MPIANSTVHVDRLLLAEPSHHRREIVATYQRLIRELPRPNQFLLLYVLDLLSVFARKSEKNLMTAASEWSVYHLIPATNLTFLQILASFSNLASSLIQTMKCHLENLVLANASWSSLLSTKILS